MKVRNFIWILIVSVLFQSCLSIKKEKSIMYSDEFVGGKKYVVSFFMNDQLYNSFEVSEGTKLLPLYPEETGKDFSGWFTSLSYTETFDFEEGINSDVSIYGKLYRSNSGIVLCFDDYYEEWDYIIERYAGKNVVFNFMISGALGVDDSRVKKMIENGHNVGNHTRSHTHINNVQSYERDDFQEKEIIFQKNTIEEYGVFNDCFAFPFGAFDRDWELRLQKIFRKLRRFGTTGNLPFYYSNSLYEDKIIVASSSIDNTYFPEDESFFEYCDSIINELTNSKETVVLTTHSIGDSEFGITLERLDYLINEAIKNGIDFIGM